MAAVCVTAQVADPKLARASLAPFSHAPHDGITATSASGFIVLHGNEPAVLASAAAVYPLLPPHRRQMGSLAGTSQSDLVPGAQLAAVLPADCASSHSNCATAVSSSNTAGLTDAASLNSSGSRQELSSTVELRLVGVAELPGVRQALARLLAAPSSAGPGGWQLGWLLHQQGQAAPTSQLSHLPVEQPAQQRPQQLQRERQLGSQQPRLAPDMLAVTSHVAVLKATKPADAAALRQAALPWPSASGGCSGAAAATAQPGQAVFAVGAPFGVLSPQHFTGFFTTGIVSAAVQLPSRSSSGGSARRSSGVSSQPALLLADLRSSPGMEGGPVFAGFPTDAARTSAAFITAAGSTAGAVAQQPPLLGMLLPPVKAPAVHVEWAAVAPIAAVAAAAETAMASAALAASGTIGITSDGGMSTTSGPSACLSNSKPATAAAAAALSGVVAVAAGGSWASGVLLSEAGHILTNAHLLQPVAAPAGSHTGGGGGKPARLQLQASHAASGAQPPVQVLLPGATGGSGGTGSAAALWAPADVLYVFQGPLDLAVLKLRHSAGQQQQDAAWRPMQLSRQPSQQGQPVLVAGFPAFSPRGSPLNGPVLTAGSLAKMVPLPTSGQPAMLLTTAAVHSGASGGAVVDAVTGQLLGLVTSNAKHSSRSSGGSTAGVTAGSSHSKQVTILPHLNFSIPAAQLAPVLLAASDAAAAEAAGGGAAGGGAGDAAAVAAWRQLDAAGAADAELKRVWRLDPRQRQGQQPQDASRGGTFGGAAPPPGLQRLLEQLAERQQHGPAELRAKL